MVDGQGQSAKAVIRDISESGCLVETPLRCQAGQQIELALSRFGIRMKGSVVHASDGRLRMAFAGDGLPAGDADRISLETIPDLVRLAKDDHSDFVKKVVDAVEAREKPQHGSLATAHHCRLGRWYDGVSDHATLELASFKAIEEPHHAVHDAGRKALAALSVDDLPAAQQQVAAMREASTRVLQALDAFGREYPVCHQSGPADKLPEIGSRGRPPDGNSLSSRNVIAGVRPRGKKFETGKGHAMVRIFSSISIRLKVTLAFELDATQAARFKQISGMHRIADGT